MDMSLSKLWEIVKGSLACWSPWGHKESDTTEQLNNSNRDFWWVGLVGGNVTAWRWCPHGFPHTTTHRDSLKLGSRGHLILSPSSKDDPTTFGKDIDPKFALAEKDRKASFQWKKKKSQHLDSGWAYFPGRRPTEWWWKLRLCSQSPWVPRLSSGPDQSCDQQVFFTIPAIQMPGQLSEGTCLKWYPWEWKELSAVSA